MLLCSAHHRLVHEGGYSIRKDHTGRRYFKRTDGRAVPAFGYHPSDVTDDDLDDAANAIGETAHDHTAAEVLMDTSAAVVLTLSDP